MSFEGPTHQKTGGVLKKKVSWVIQRGGGNIMTGNEAENQFSKASWELDKIKALLRLLVDAAIGQDGSLAQQEIDWVGLLEIVNSQVDSLKSELGPVEAFLAQIRNQENLARHFRVSPGRPTLETEELAPGEL